MRRFYKEATIETVERGFTVALDGRPVKTPSKAALILPNQGLAEMVVTEWNAQEDHIIPDRMPATRMANSAIDKVAINRTAISDMLLDYGESDLLCYRATHPETLAKRQAQIWDSYLDWAKAEYDVELAVTTGIMPVEQPSENRPKFAAQLSGLSDFQLTGFHDFVVISGSLILALAVQSNRHDLDKIWSSARIDEQWQAEQWGEDDEAKRNSERKYADLVAAKAFYDAAS